MSDSMKTFLCYSPGDMEPGDSRPTKARYADEAANEFAEWHDSVSSEYPDEQDVMVSEDGGKTWEKFTVFAEQSRVYRAIQSALERM